MTRAAIIEPSSGIAGDMMLGALLDLGVDPQWLRDLPRTVGLPDVTVRIMRVRRAEIAAWKVDFDIPPQPHGRHLKHIRTVVDACAAPQSVRDRANRAFELLTEAEAAVHGTTVDKVHLHEVGAVDAILDIVGNVWGLELLGVTQVYCGTLMLGDGYAEVAHGRMAVPTPAVTRLIEGFDVSPGPANSGELTTPTGAVLMKTLARAGIPSEYRPVKSGYGAGAKDFKGRANVLRVTIADVATSNGSPDPVILLACEIDDMTGEYLAAAATAVKAAGALDVILVPVFMKKGRPGTRIEVLCDRTAADQVEAALFVNTTTLGVRRTAASRTALPRTTVSVRVFGHDVSIKVARLPDGSTRIKPEFEDIARVAAATGRPAEAVHAEALKVWASK